MSRLYVIGNGFDCYGHSLRTRYQDFRDYLVYHYPDCLKKSSIPEQTLTTNHHDYDYDMNNLVGYIVKTLDDCESGYWSNIEEAIGSYVFDEFSYEFDDDYDNMTDNEESRAIAANDEKADGIKEAFGCIKRLFYEWVSNELASIDYSSVSVNRSARTVFSDNNPDDRFYLNFNYTRTLEEIYKIDASNVCHLHGIVGEPFDAIIFGHGSETNDREKEFYIYESVLNDLHEELKKNKQKPKQILNDWLKEIGDINEIYSYGFSFSDVDLEYIRIIRKYLNKTNVVWYLNNYDYHNNPEYKDKLRKLGFVVEGDNRW